MSTKVNKKIVDNFYQELAYQRVRLVGRRCIMLASALVGAGMLAWWGYTIELINNDFYSRWLWGGVLFLMYSWYELHIINSIGWYKNSRSFTPELTSILLRAFHYAWVFGHREVHPLHIIVASLAYSSGQKLVMRLGFEPRMLVQYTRARFLVVSNNKEPRYTPLIDRLLLSINPTSSLISAPEVLIASVEACGEYRRFLTSQGITPSALRNIYDDLEYKNNRQINRQAVVVELSVDCLKNKLPICVGRDEVVNKIVNQLLNKQSVSLLGAPGVGEQAIIYGVTHAIINQHREARVVQIDILSYLTKLEGAQQLLSLMGDLSQTPTTVVVFLHLEQWYNAPAGLGGTLTFGDIISKAITTYGLLVLVICNEVSWTECVHKSFLSHYLTVVLAPPLSVVDTMRVLSVCLPRWEDKWRVRLLYKSLVTAVSFGPLKNSDCVLPGSAIAALSAAAHYARQTRGDGTVVTPADVEHVCWQVSDALLLSLENKDHISLNSPVSETISRLCNELTKVYKKQGINMIISQKTLSELEREAQDKILGFSHIKSILADRIEYELSHKSTKSRRRIVI